MKCDLHIHSCLSPCADLTMVPNEVVKYSPEIIAICDHNSGGNVLPFLKVFEKHGKILIPGIEIQSFEDVHILGYFKNFNDLITVSKIVAEHLPKINYDPEKFGYQVYVNENDEFVSMENLPLGFPTDFSIQEIIDLILDHSGLPAYAHIGRKFGVLYQLGIFPQTQVRIAEVTNKEEYSTAKKNGFITIASSDAHFLNQIGERYSIIEKEIKNVEDFLNLLYSGKVKTIWDF
ncbi:MAG: PHP domain-containing protein [Thermosipho sp. (in: Bacteria)]|nr:PHP domain-containing protein [Thermosipho sp. (in: thermotogales)]